MIVQMVEETCYKCGITFGITKGLQDDLVRCKNTFYCPMGHPQCYVGETAAQEYKRLFKRAQENFNNANERATNLKRSNAAFRGVITKLKKAE